MSSNCSSLRILLPRGPKPKTCLAMRREEWWRMDGQRDWVTKTVTGCCGINHFLSYWKPGVRNICPSCKYPGETIMHITRCPEVGRTTIFNEMVAELAQWMTDNYTPYTAVTAMITTYLRNQGTASMSSRLAPHSHFFALASAFDHLGWRCLLEGRIPTLLVHCTGNAQPPLEHPIQIRSHWLGSGLRGTTSPHHSSTVAIP